MEKLKKIIKVFFLGLIMISQILPNTVYAEENEIPFNVLVEGEGKVVVSYSDKSYEIDQQISLNVENETIVHFDIESENGIDSIQMNNEDFTYEDSSQTVSFDVTIKEATTFDIKFKEDVELEENDLETMKDTIQVENEALEGSTLTVIEHAYFGGSDPEYYRNTQLWRLSNGALAVCGHPASAGPVDGLTASVYVVTNDVARKALFYTWENPLSGIDTLSDVARVCIATELMQHAMTGNSVTSLVGDVTLYNRTMGTWWDLIQSMPNPPSSYVVYGVNYSSCGSAYSNVTGSIEPYQDVFFGVYEEVDGNLKLTKSSKNTTLVENNDCYSLEGTTYGLYSNQECTDAVQINNTNVTISVKEDGTSDTITGIPPGTYYIKETKAGKGYALDTNVYSVQINEDETTTFEAYDIPQTYPGELLNKEDKDTKSNKVQGESTLSNAKFLLKYYNAYYDEDPSTLSIQPTRSWTIVTDKDGKASFENVCEGDELYTNEEGEFCLPLGTVTIQEIEAPKGYQKNETVYVEKITAQGNEESVYTYTIPTILDDVITSKFQLTKVITDGDQSETIIPEIGAEFDVVLKSYYDLNNQDMKKAIQYAKEYGTEKEYEEMKTDSKGVTSSKELAYGTYIIQQMSVGENGQETEPVEEPFTFVVEENSSYGLNEKGARIEEEDGMVYFYVNDIPIRSYISLVKKDEKTNQNVTNSSATFQIKMLDSKGNAVTNYSKSNLKTDENGIISMKNGLYWYDSFMTNSDNRLSVIESSINNNKGIYQALANEERGTVTLPVQLPLGSYQIIEVQSPNGYLKSDSQSFVVSKSTITQGSEDPILEVSYTDTTPTGKIILNKTFEESDLEKKGSVQFECVANEDILNPEDGSILYKKGDLVKGIQVLKDGSKVEKDGVFTLDSNQLVIENLPLSVSGASYVLKEVKTYESYQLNEDVIHFTFTLKDNTKEYVQKASLKNETIKIHTNAHSANSDSHSLNPTSTIEFVDTVSYEGLHIGQTYTLTATLMDKESQQLLKDSNGKEIESTITFTCTNADGSIDVPFKLKLDDLSSMDFVVYESLSCDNSIVAKHQDIKDQDQSIQILDSSIHTQAYSTNGSNIQQIGKDITLKDTVFIENIVQGEEYTLVGTLMNAQTGEAVLDADGKEITNSKSFVYEKQESEELEFTLNSTNLAGKKTVFFETLYDEDGKEVANHKDLKDSKQTIEFIDMHTNAKSSQNSKVELISKNMKITDTVTYTGLEVGQTYILQGKLMNKETKEVILDNNGKEIMSQKILIPEKEDGSIDLTFEFDGSNLETCESVVFEELYIKSLLIAEHKDIEDQNQTVSLKPLTLKINKVDTNNTNIVNKDFTFTMYQDKNGTNKIMDGQTDSSKGISTFTIEEGTFYIKETKAPNGYSLSNEVIKVERKGNEVYINDKKVNLEDEYIVSTSFKNSKKSVQTSIQNFIPIFLSFLLVSMIGIILLKSKII